MKLGTQEMAELLGVKPHVLRYWEQEIPLIAPERDSGGRKVYRDQDIRLLHRIRHLIIDKKFTVQGALERILEEAGPEKAPRKAAFEGLRAELLTLRGRLTEVRSPGRSIRSGESEASAPDRNEGRVDAAGEQHQGLHGGDSAGDGGAQAGGGPTALERIDGRSAGDTWALTALPLDRVIDAPQEMPAIMLRRPRSDPGEYFRSAAAELVCSGEVLIVTASHLFLSSPGDTPAECHPVWPKSRRSLLEGAVERARAVAYRLGRPPHWLHMVWEEYRPALEAALASYSPLFQPQLLSVPGLSSREELPEQVAHLAGSPYATLLGWLHAAREHPSLIHLTALEEVSAPFLDEELLAHHLAGGRRASARACDRGGGRWRLSGGMIYSSDALAETVVPLERPRGAADTKERQVSLAHLFAALGGVAIPAEDRCLRPSRYDRGWPGELEELLALRFREWCERAGRAPEREIDPLFADTPEELARRRVIRVSTKGDTQQ